MTELDPWARAVTGQLADLAHIVAHELIHFEQAPLPGKQSLLVQSMREGAPDFIAEMISGKHINAVAKDYGEAHEAALWTEFRASMDSAKVTTPGRSSPRAGTRLPRSPFSGRR